MRPSALALAALLVARGAATVPSGTLIMTPASPIAAGQSPWATATGDFNGDGRTDMAVATEIRCQTWP